MKMCVCVRVNIYKFMTCLNGQRISLCKCINAMDNGIAW